jgi:zinc/manganese transport system ATP-binding protein
VITSAVLSRLYGSDIDVVRLKGRIFVMSGDQDVERQAHRHGNGAEHAHELQGAR